MTYDELLIEAENDGLTVKEKPLKTADGRIRGKKIAIRQDIPTTIKKAEVLTEEMGHYHTGVGRILEQQSVNDTKQERAARLWAYNKRIGLSGIINAHKAHCTNNFEMADFFNVTEDFLTDALECYRQIYGTGKMVDNYIVKFEPYLQVGEYYILE